MKPRTREHRLMWGALVITWLVTALVSVLEWNGQSRTILLQAGYTDPRVIDALIGLGVAVDVAVGLALLLWPGRGVYLGALAAMGAMTLTGTWIEPRLWLDPLGPLLKNLPIAAMLWTLAQQEPR